MSYTNWKPFWELMLARKKRVLLLVLAVLTAGFAVLSAFVISVPPSFIDLHVSEEIQERNGKLLDTIMVAVSWFGTFPTSVILIAVTALLFFLFRMKREGSFILLTAISGVVTALLKMLINRPRPTANLVKIIEVAKHQSFPSGHTLFYVVFFGMLVIIMGNRKTLPAVVRLSVVTLSLLLIFLVPFSRIYLGAHWFTDVVGGFLCGLACLSILAYAYLFATDKII